MENSSNTRYTVTVYTENSIGLLSAISSIFTRRSISIWSLTASASAIEGVHKITISCRADERNIAAVAAQIEKRIDVIKAFYYRNDEIIYREIALYKCETDMLLDSGAFEDIIARHNATVVEMNHKFTVLQVTGKSGETSELYAELSAIGKVLQFTRSGRIAVTRSDHEFVDEFLLEREYEKNKQQ